jgi:hypothetical protein
MERNRSLLVLLGDRRGVMQDRYRQIEGADQATLFGERAAPGWFARMVAAIGMLLRAARR